MIDAADHLFDGKTSLVGDAVEDLLRFRRGRGMSEAGPCTTQSSFPPSAPPVGKAPKGTLRVMRPDELAAP